MEIRSSSVQIEVHAPICAAAAEMLTPDALRFVGFLCHKFEDRRRSLLNARKSHAMDFDAGEIPSFPKDGGTTRRESHSYATKDLNWRC
eukprot:CAMPEP_0197837806 /NCGR_PEP_ID=MMETSP1437-20131217/33369_1 /TAXON_ID=49252 ORGANISM="Eucampia antarctica, Strain CCMP1452" /NCGR_SAMPLE_ID=MMETSP1437 /ASSEMBLY_ACC=CAM_ASM_001096 /LENGTH=88 /DNA_ID=CAMNT_0043445153 /DNA_START=33 /DNA_END=296 /DNA_ORIENTATION=-